MPIIEVSDSKQKISSRQISAQRRNLFVVCRFAIKTLIDKAVLTGLDDECEELRNFLAILEEILNHRIKPLKSWYVMEEPGSFWSYIQAACKSVPHSCISGIAALDNVKPAIAKGRAWLRCVLMEKRLSEYLTTAVHNTRLTRKYYLDDAIMLSEDVPILFAELLGLNAIDFSFCLKGDNLDLSTPMVVDYSPYLKFQQSQESISQDEEELRALSTKSSIDSGVSSAMTYEELGYLQKYRLLDEKYKSACEQKGYLEELLRLRENQLDAIQQQNQDMACTIRQLEMENQKDSRELEGVIIELQEQLSSMKFKYAQMQERLTSLADYPTHPSKLDQGNVIPMEDLGSIRSLSLSPAMAKQIDCDQQSLSSLECSVQPVTSSSKNANHHIYREDTQSMIPLTGSLTSLQSILLTEPLTPQQSIKILTGSRVSEGNEQYTEYISFGPAFTKDIGAIVPMENEDINVINSIGHADINVITSMGHPDIDVRYENSETVGNQDRHTVEHSSLDSGEIYLAELNSESSKGQGQITLHSFANIDINDSVKVEDREVLLSDIFEEMEQLDRREKLEEKSDSDTSTLGDSEFVLLDADA
ncbi:hypothetical protein CHS0354_003845 [Potamilus streckersoni]|uniref:RUN domain-containing protein n=1 Tax=Potamilus streckersoni TaxID=2493646 RepID=A0AAE0SGE8_9BIVA|nr:hypothetical protein CHS0354_003845 [Potamilus streckersoni]